MRGRLPRLLEDLFRFRVDVVRLIFVGLERLPHFATFDHVDIISFVTLLVNLTAASAHDVLELLGQALELLVSKVFENGDPAQIL